MILGVAPCFDGATENYIYLEQHHTLMASQKQGKRNPFTEEEINLLKKIYAETPKKRLEELFPKHTYESIRKKAKKLGLKREPGFQPWSSEEEAILRELYPTAKREEIMKALPNRTWAAIRARAEFLGVKRLIAPLWKDYEDSKLTRGEITDFELGYIIGLFEGEGWIHIHRRKNKKHRPWITLGIGNTNLELLKKVQEIIGGSLTENSKGKTIMYHLTIRGHNNVLLFLEKVLPHLIVKRKRAEEAIKYLRKLRNSPVGDRK